MLKNKSLFMFIGVGFVITVAVWGFVGGCGTSKLHIKAGPPAEEQSTESEGLILEEEQTAQENTNVYTVTAGDTLWGISKKLKVSVQTLKSENKLAKDSISIGQRLVIPGGGQTVSGDNSGLLRPAVTIGTRNDREDEKTAPDVSGAKTLPAGQTVCPAPSPKTTQLATEMRAETNSSCGVEHPAGRGGIYKVMKGDSIWRIAQIHGTTIERILELNGLSKNSRLNPGQEIVVPGDTD